MHIDPFNAKHIEYAFYWWKTKINVANIDPLNCRNYSKKKKKRTMTDSVWDALSQNYAIDRMEFAKRSKMLK